MGAKSHLLQPTAFLFPLRRGLSLIHIYYDPEDPEKMYVEGDLSVLGAEVLYFCLAVVLLALMVSFSR